MDIDSLFFRHWLNNNFWVTSSFGKFFRCVADVSLLKRDGKAVLDFDSDDVDKIIEKNMALNLYRDGVWGTFRHLVMQSESNKSVFIYKGKNFKLLYFRRSLSIRRNRTCFRKHFGSR